MNPSILVIGAASHSGRETLIAFAKDSRSANYALKAGVKHSNLKDSLMDSFGFETVKCDLDDPSSVETAMSRASKVFLILGNEKNRVEECKNAVEALKKSKVSHFLFLSAAGAEKNTSDFAKQIGECENMIKSGLTNWTIIRSSFFQENLLGQGEQITSGELRLGLGSDGAIAPISLADVGEVACNILLEPDFSGHAQKVYELTGDELLTGNQMAAILAKVVGRDVTYKALSHEETKKHYVDHGWSEYEAEGLAGLFQDFAKNQSNRVSQDANKLLGHAPQKLEHTLHAHKEKLTLRLPDGVVAKAS